MTSQERLEIQEIQAYMTQVFKKYNAIRSLKTTADAQSCCVVDKPAFWDVVILTTFDVAQKESFEQQINHKRQEGHLPEVPIHVVADPPDQKLGVGGSTLHVLIELQKIYGDDLFKKKMLIIHSGGSSQRLPSYSVLGKIFTPVPARELQLSSTVPQMLDLKLAMYLPFCELLGPGAFVTCADDIETYLLSVSASDIESLKCADVVALAHPSSIKIGEGHGVYVFEKPGLQSTDTGIVHTCAEVLQKAPESVMRSRGAVFNRDVGGTSEETVWSDSVFWLSDKVYRALMQWYIKNSPVSSELDAYAHFIPCFGTRMANAKSTDYQDFRSEMLPILKGFCLSVITLEKSRFYHLGTMEEYLMHFISIESFNQELGIVKNTSNMSNVFSVDSPTQLASDQQVVFIETFFSDSSVQIRTPNETAKLIIEHSQVSISFTFSSDLIISNCIIRESPNVTFISNKLDFFGNLLYHTAPVILQGELFYVTVAFDLNGSMKKASSAVDDINIFGCSLGRIAQILGYELNKVIPDAKGSKVSLWTARIFVGGKTAAESFWLTHHAVNKIRNDVFGEKITTEIHGCAAGPLFSMSDIVKHKDLDTLLKDKSDLFKLLKV